MMNVELVLLVFSVLVAAFAGWRIVVARQAGRQDQSHVATLIGSSTDRTFNAGTVVGRGEVSVGPFTRLLRRAGIAGSAAVMLAILVLAGVIVALALASVVPGVPWAYPVFGIATVFILYSIIGDIARWRAWRFENRLADAIDLMVGGLAAGQNTVEALATASQGALQPVKDELAGCVERLNASVPVERALMPLVERYDCEGTRLFTHLLIAKWEVGGPLAPSLQAVNRTLRIGLRLRNQLHTYVSSAQNAALFVALMPYIVIAIFLWKTPEAIQRIFLMPSGRSLFCGAILIQILAFVWLRSLLRSEL